MLVALYAKKAHVVSHFVKHIWGAKGQLAHFCAINLHYPNDNERDYLVGRLRKGKCILPFLFFV